MSWNDQSGGPGGKGQGPWGGGPKRPWGQPPRQPQAPQGPDLEEMWRQFRERLGGGGGPSGGARGAGRGPITPPLIFGVLFVGWLLSGVYIVNEGERAVVTRLGDFNRVTDPGFHMHLPPPFETKQVFNVTGQRIADIGFVQRGNQSTDNPEESLMITGDRNIVEVHFRVYYNISDVVAFAFNVRDPDGNPRNPGDHPGAVRQTAESVMREVIGRRQLEPIITTERGAVEADAEQLMQSVLNDYQIGVRVLQVELLSAAAPPAVVEAFNDVINASQDAEALLNNANRDTSRIVNEAQAYRERTIREATGDAEAFNAVYSEYRQAPQVTRDRIYIETMERVYRNGNLVILDQRGGAVPYLPLDGMIRRNAPAASAGGAN